ncbi:PQQ-dependent dehydrogenase, methanol/ethanol family [Sphingomonas canadensis]|uniref:PQQ-dependent dehydrogenase, methanol/ethanol family n=1 Tax=Sphingomonas canadensis TaxID=1219257 RepID=A0ABW3HH01_9SPHN|nr:PQQ-dependent dehydrogenase, methanol/ethanol family [Sphingomonas canadensis]MCW3838294.1 PQQ-dependent dehydrogenase, methanol/ethanol family [Sphingomonas canadensis]
MLPTRPMLAAAAAAVAIFAAACSPGGSGAADKGLLGAPERAGDWPRSGRDMGDSYFSPLDGINAGNVTKLGFAWEFRDFLVRGRTHYGMESTPVMVDGTLYFSGPWGEVYALDARTGAKRWTHDTEADGSFARNACCGVVNKGVAVADGRVFVAAMDGKLFALDAATGKPLWKTDTLADKRWNYSSTGAPQIAGDVVMIGNAGADMGARGYVSAYDVKTGKLAWRFWAVPGDPAAGPDETPEVTLARKTWPKDTRWELGLGGNAWNGLAYDPATNTAYLGLGNGGPHPAWLRSRSGEVMDNLFLSSIVAVDADTGRMKWYYQTTPGDSWDYTATSPMVLADMEIGGRTRQVLMQAPKNGVFYVLDRVTGELLRADPYTRINWTTGVDMKTGRPRPNPEADYRSQPQLIWPSGAGGHSWQPMAYSPRTGLVYIPVYEAGMEDQAHGPAQFIPGNINQATFGRFPPFSAESLKGRAQSKFEGRLKAWDPRTGRIAWESAPLTFLNGGTMVSGDLVFQGTASGHLDAYDAATGKQLLHLPIGTVIMGAPMTYALDGVQYVAVLAGAGGPQGGFFGPGVIAAERENYQRLIVLKLGGKDVPLPPKRAPLELAPLPEPIAAGAAAMQRGEALFLDRCSRCHFPGGAFAVYPNLWNMPPSVIENFEQIVGKGALAFAGMASFADQLSPADIAAIKAYIINDTIARRSGKETKAPAPSRQTH